MYEPLPRLCCIRTHHEITAFPLMGAGGRLGSKLVAPDVKVHSSGLLAARRRPRTTHHQNTATASRSREDWTDG